jgi:hypothetical protein
MQPVHTHVSLAFFTSGFLVHLYVSVPDLIVAFTLAQGVPFEIFVAADAAGVIKREPSKALAIMAPNNLRVVTERIELLQVNRFLLLRMRDISQSCCDFAAVAPVHSYLFFEQ